MLIDVPGGKKRADAIQIGDRVASRNEFSPTGSVEYNAVEEVFIRIAEIVNLHVGGQIIETTAAHPFYVPGRGWVATGALKIGDFLSGRDGELLLVEGVVPSGAVERVYNWRVAEYHTYFVSPESWMFAVWAHNADYSGGKKIPKPGATGKAGVVGLWGTFGRVERWRGRLGEA